MDELQISGRRFISSRRIARDNGYHTDYIGQLIRGGKIKGQKVGRTWYVDAITFDVYLSGEASLPVQPTVAGYSDSVATESPEVVSPSLAKPPAPVVAPTVIAHTPAVEIKTEEAKVEEKKEEQKIEIKKVAEPVVAQARYVPVASGGLRFVADDEPLLPEISTKESITHVMPTISARAAPIETKKEAAVFERRPNSKRLIVALGVVAMLVFIFSAVVSSAVFQKLNIEAGNSASVGYGLSW